MSASSLSLPIFLRINFLISYLDSNRLTEHNRLTHTESFAEWQKAGAGCTSRAFKHPCHDVTAPDVWPSILTDYTYDSELDNADGVPLAFRRSSMFPKGNWIMQLADIVSVAKIKIMYASAQRTHSEPGIWRSCAFNRRPIAMPDLDGVKPITLPICRTSEPD